MRLFLVERIFGRESTQTNTAVFIGQIFHVKKNCARRDRKEGKRNARSYFTNDAASPTVQ